MSLVMLWVKSTAIQTALAFILMLVLVQQPHALLAATVPKDSSLLHL